MNFDCVKFLVIRHAQSANNALPEHLRVCDPGLTELGAQQAKLLARYYAQHRIDQLYCSGFLRSLETAAPLAAMSGITPYVHARLFEVKGCYSGYLPGKMQAEAGLGRTEILSRYGAWEIDPRIGEHGWYHGQSMEQEQAADLRAAEIADWMASVVRELNQSLPSTATRVLSSGSQAWPTEPQSFAKYQMHRREAPTLAMVIHADFKVKLLSAIAQRHAGPAACEAWLYETPCNTSVTTVVYGNGTCNILDYNNVDHLTSSELVSV